MRGLRPKSRLLLEVLRNNADRIVSKDELITAVWGHEHVEPQALFQLISEIRAACGNRECIGTFPNRGYRWQGLQPRRSWRRLAAPVAAAAVSAALLLVAAWPALGPGSSPRALDASWSPALVALSRGLDRRADGDLTAAIKLMQLAVDEHPTFGLAKLELAQTLLMNGAGGEAGRYAHEALSDARIAGDRYLEISAQLMLSRLSWQSGNIARAVELSSAAGRTAREQGYSCAARVTDDLSRQLSAALVDPHPVPAASPMLSLSSCRLDLGVPEASGKDPLQKIEGLRSSLNPLA